MLVLFVLATVLLCSTTYILLKNIGDNNLAVNAVDNSLLNVSVVKHKDSYNTTTGDYDINGMDNDDTVVIESIQNGQFVLLDTSGELGDSNTLVRESILIHFGNVADVGNVDIKFNGVSINVNSEVVVRETDTSASYEWFGQYLHILTSQQVNERGLKTSFGTYEKASGSIIDNPEGRYDIAITYRDNTGGVGIEQTIYFSFYAITEATYTKINEQPTLNDAIPNVEGRAGYYKIFSYNYDNSNTKVAVETIDELTGASSFDYTGEHSSNDRLYYPTLTFNPEKYLLTIERVLYKSVERTTMTFSTLSTDGGITENGTLTLTTTLNGNTTRKTIPVTKNSDGKYIVSLELTRVGEYTITKTFQLRTGTVNTTNGLSAQYVPVSAENVLTSAGESEEDSQNITLPEFLAISGYQTNYAITSTTTSIMYNDSYSDNEYLEGHIYSTNYNFAKNDANYVTATPTSLNMIPTDTIKAFLDNQIANNTVTTLASTNQAPVSFDYLGKLRTNANNIIYNWYVRVTNSGVATAYAYTRGQQFIEAGLYYVHLSYTDSMYEDVTRTQVICFRIERTITKATLYTLDTQYTIDSDQSGSSSIYLSPNDQTLSTLGVSAYTNKNVYIEWQKEGPFDSVITATYAYDANYQDSTNYNNRVQGLTYYSYLRNDDGTVNTVYQRATTGGTTIFTNSGKYSIKLIKNGDENSAAYFDFIIDKESISGIKALQVNGSEIATDNNGNYIILSQQQQNTSDGFNLTVGAPFAWTWDSKRSGAPIEYAKYFYASLNDVNNFVTPEAITNGNEMWVQTNGAFSNFSYPTDYSRVEQLYSEDFDENYYDSVNASQIINTPQVAILLLRDAAGNTAMFVTIYDNTQPNIIQEPEQTTYQNIITVTTTLTWGTHKVLQITDDSGNATDVSKLIYGGTSSSGSMVFDQGWSLQYGDYTYALPEVLIDNANLQFGIGQKRFEEDDTSATSQTYLKVDLEYIRVNMNNVIYYLGGTDANSRAYEVGAKIIVYTAETNTETSYTYLANLNDEPISINSDGTIYMVYLDGDDAVGECQYVFTIYDELENTRAETITVNLDQSLGTLYSYSSVSGNTLNSISQVDSQFNRRYVPQTYSSNRSYIAFSWREPENSSFSIESVVVDFYPITYDTSSSNYPYSETASSTTLYDLGEGGATNLLNVVNIGADGQDVNGQYYQTNALSYLTYLPESGLPGSQAGMYVFTRKYTDNFTSLDYDSKNGDVLIRTYTYYLDRTPVLYSAENDTQIGSDIALKFGFDSYNNYTSSEYPQQSFSNFSSQSNSDTFGTTFTVYNSTDSNNMNGTVREPTGNVAKTFTPTVENISKSGNLVAVGVDLPTVAIDNHLNANKYYNQEWIESTDQEIIELMDTITNGYRNSSRLIISVQYFATESMRSTSDLTFYANISTSGSHGYKNFDELDQAFTQIGYYRVILFDMANTITPLSGDYRLDFEHFINYSMDPNYTIVNFRIVGITPSVTVQEKLVAEDSTYTTITNQTPTNSDLVRITFSDPIDEYQAHIDYKNITITQTYSKYGVTQNTTTYTPQLLGEYDESNDSNVTEPSLYYSNIESTSRKQYYIILPKSITEPGKAYSQYDCTYTVTVRYITKDGNTVSNEFTIDDARTETERYRYYRSTTTISVDHTAPYKNLFNLIDNDPYLQSLGANFISELKANIDNPEYNFLENYAFSIPLGYKFTAYDVDDTNSAGILYYKAYRDTGGNNTYDGTLNKQTVVPGTSAYNDENNASRRFYPADTSNFTMLYGQSEFHNATTINTSGYYDIVEYDVAGNYRVYTVFVCDESVGVNFNTDADNTYQLKLTKTGYDVVYNNQSVSADNAEYTISSATLMFDSMPNVDNNTPIYWQRVGYSNLQSNTTMNYYLAPNGALEQFVSITSRSDIGIFHTIDELLAQLNSDVVNAYNNYVNSVGSKLQFTFANRLSSNYESCENVTNFSLYLRTPGVKLVETIDDLALTVNGNYFDITLPTYTLSTELVSFKAYLNGNEMTADSTLTQAIVNPPVAGTRYRFSLSSTTSYTFVFVDNFGRSTTLVYPIDSTTRKELVFSGNQQQLVVNGVTYTYTSTDTQFVYQSNVLTIINITITDMDTNQVVYANQNGMLESSEESGAREFYTYSSDILTNSITTISFVSSQNVHYLYEIDVGMTASNMYHFSYVLYTHFPNIILTDTSNVTLWEDGVEKITSRPVMISWQPVENALFNPRVVLRVNGRETTITSPTTVSSEGDYTILLVNDLGTYTAGTINFTIRMYDVSVYGVYQTLNGQTTELTTSREKSYNYLLNGQNTLLTEYFFLGNWETIDVVCNEDKQLTARVVDVINNTQIYHIEGLYNYKISIYIAITRIPTSTTTTLVDDFRVNGTLQRDYYLNLMPTTTTTGDLSAIVTWTTTYQDPEYASSPEIPNFYVIELWYNNTYVGVFDSGNLNLTESGVYNLRLRDLVGQYQRFGTSYNYFTITIYNDVIFTVNGEAAIYNAVFNDDVTLSITDYANYNTSDFTFTATRNNASYNATLTNGSFVFTEPGVYVVNMSGTLTSMGRNAPPLTNSYIFTILSANEARLCYEFSPITGYEITQITKQGNTSGTVDAQDITDAVRGNNSAIYSFYVSPATEWGTGYYTLTVKVAASGFKPEQQYTFSFWINDSTPIITPSRDWGSASTSGFTLTFNPTTIYERVGDSILTVNNITVYTFNQETINALQTTDPVVLDSSTFRGTSNTFGDYIIQMYTSSGNLISSNRITINEPFNTAAIVLIVIFGVALIAGIITFIVLRTRMKVR